MAARQPPHLRRGPHGPSDVCEVRPPSRESAPTLRISRADDLPDDFQFLLLELQRFVSEALRQELSDFQTRARNDLREELDSQLSALSWHRESANGKDQGLRDAGIAKSTTISSPSVGKTLSTEEEQIGYHNFAGLAKRGLRDPITLQQLQKFQSSPMRRRNSMSVRSGMSMVLRRGKSTHVLSGQDASKPRKLERTSSESVLSVDGKSCDGQGSANLPNQVSSPSCRQAWQGAHVHLQSREHVRSPIEDADEEDLSLYDLMCYYVCSPTFDYGSGIIVMLNAIVLGIQIDWQARRVTNELIWPFRVLEILFCIAFTVELCLRVAVHGREFFSPALRKWHALDIVLVGSQLLDNLITIFADDDTGNVGKNFSMLRLMRFLRLMRVTRLVRVLRLIGELRMLVMSILGALKHLSWAVTLLFLLMYVMGVYITQLTLDHRLDHDITDDASTSNDTTAALVFFYGSLGDTILSVYKAVTGGVDWGDILEPLRERISFWTVPGFMMYIAFVVLCMLNVITGVFVESALATAKRDRTSCMVSNVKSVFDQYDDNRSGKLNWEEFKSACESKDMKTILSALDIDSSEADGLFHLLDVKETGHVTPSEFAVGCVRLSGNSKALELAILMRQFSEFTNYFNLYSRRVDANLRLIVNTLEQQKPS